MSLVLTNTVKKVGRLFTTTSWTTDFFNTKKKIAVSLFFSVVYTPYQGSI